MVGGLQDLEVEDCDVLWRGARIGEGEGMEVDLYLTKEDMENAEYTVADIADITYNLDSIVKALQTDGYTVQVHR